MTDDVRIKPLDTSIIPELHRLRDRGQDPELVTVVLAMANVLRDAIKREGITDRSIGEHSARLDAISAQLGAPDPSASIRAKLDDIANVLAQLDATVGAPDVDDSNDAKIATDKAIAELAKRFADQHAQRSAGVTAGSGGTAIHTLHIERLDLGGDGNRLNERSAAMRKELYDLERTVAELRGQISRLRSERGALKEELDHARPLLAAVGEWRKIAPHGDACPAVRRDDGHLHAYEVPLVDAYDAWTAHVRNAQDETDTVTVAPDPAARDAPPLVGL